MTRSNRIGMWLMAVGLFAIGADAGMTAALAGSVGIDSSARGYFRETSATTAARAPEATTVGSAGAQNFEYRSYYTFDLSGFTETATSATLRISTDPGANGYTSADASETIAALSFTGVSADLSGTIASGAAAYSLFTQLGAGAEYDTRVLTAADKGTVIEFDVLAADVNSAAGGLFTVALRSNSLSSATTEEFVNFGVGGFGTLGGPTHELAIQFTAVPEPGTGALVGLGVLGLAIGRRRRRGRSLERPGADGAGVRRTRA